MAAIALVRTAAGDPDTAAPGAVTVTPEPRDLAQDGDAPPAARPVPVLGEPPPGVLEPPELHPVAKAMARTTIEQDTIPVGILIKGTTPACGEFGH